ncbi:MAG: lipoate--protein ligase family protein [Thaumarchaeota archaeon]|nr:lipoate--protein ligase family protein [Nitrososphaerota archaeon]MCS4539265.1 lipoate--protein ligase family protein [Nitrososphaerota archaeon]
MGLRRLETRISDAYTNLALEEAIFNLNESRTVRVWRNERSVIIGRAQLAKFETDVEYCESERIPVVRRFTAGGAVYNGPGNLNWSIFLRNGSANGKTGTGDGARSVFSTSASIIVEVLRRLGIQARLEEPNRIVTDEGKVSGMAAYLSRERVLCHGTLLLRANLEDAAALTSPKRIQIDPKYVRSREARIANLGLKESSFIRGLWEILQEGSDEDSGLGELSGEELQVAERLTKYRDREWNLGDPFKVKLN